MLAATLSAIPVIPAIGLVLVLSVDWFMGIARALGNLIGNCVATVVVAAWEGDIDHAKAHKVLNGETEPQPRICSPRRRGRRRPTEGISGRRRTPSRTGKPEASSQTMTVGSVQHPGRHK